jgi:hypothetical protein
MVIEQITLELFGFRWSHDSGILATKLAQTNKIVTKQQTNKIA